MATVHSLSVLTNACVKPPINPSNGLASTLNERPDPTLDMTWAGRDADFKDREIKQYRNTVSTKAVKFGRTLTAPATATRTNTPAKKTRQTVADRLSHELSGLSDVKFYTKLRELQHEHKKTVEASESLYNEKVAALHTAVADCDFSYGAGGDDLSRSEDYTVLARKYFPSETQASMEFNNGASPAYEFEKSNGHGTVVDRIRDMSVTKTKPPSGRLSKSLDYGADHHHPEKSRHESWADDVNGYFWRSGCRNSTDTETGSGGSDGERSLDEEDHMSVRSCDETKSYAMAHIKKMWDNFSIDDYMPTEPRPKRRRSNSMSRLTTSRTNNSRNNNSCTNSRSVDNWRHRITVPKPFKMEVRRLKKEPLKTRAMREVEREHQLKKQQEDTECLRKFKAKPVPAHIYLPLYNEIMEDKETKSRTQREYVKEMLKSTEKPFQFMKREEQKKKERMLEMWTARYEEDEMKKQFKANPFPEHIFEESITDKIKEEELYRKIRIQMRAEELLRSSSLPPNMSARSYNGKYRSKTFTDVKRKSCCLPTQPKFHPTINEVVPDFEELHRHFLKEMGQRKMAREATVCKPFKLRTEQSRQKHQIYDDIAKDETKMKEKKWKFSRNGHTSNCSKSFSSHMLGGSLTSLDSIPTKMTTAAQLRASVNKSKAQRDLERVRREREAEHERRQKERRLKKLISSRVGTYDPNVSTRRTSKLKEYRETQQQRADNYKQELEEMRQRVDSRPLLFEQTSQINAKLAAEKKYKDALKHMGIDERSLTRNGSASAADIATACDSDDNDIPVYSQHSDTYRSQHSGSERHATTDNYATDASGQRSRSRNPSSAHSYTRSRSRSYERTADDASDGQIEEDIQYDEVYD